MIKIIPLSLMAFFLILAMAPFETSAATPISGLKAAYRNGQVFLTWNEATTETGTFFNVYASDSPITKDNLSKATKIAHHIEPHSATDWWQSPTTYDKNANAQAASSVGFVIETGAAALSPESGLFVHTVTSSNLNQTYYAVTLTVPSGQEDLSIAPGETSLTAPVSQKVEPIQPIWIGSGVPPQSSERQRELELFLHARSGSNQKNPAGFLIFGDTKQGWREGLPFKFDVDATQTTVTLKPRNRIWTFRAVTESWDARDHVPAVETFWYGCNNKIYDAKEVSSGLVANYTEEMLLSLMDWATRAYNLDSSKVTARGTSMGGSGTVSMLIHHPERFSAGTGIVPVVSYTKPGQGSAKRLETVCGSLQTAKTIEGELVSDRMNGEKTVRNCKGDLPFMFLIHGRTDKSIPWENNPGFYKALQESRQAFAAYWSDGDHTTACKKENLPEDIQPWLEGITQKRFSTRASYPAFTNCSTDKNPGNGDPTNGDIVGWINRGMDWSEIVDTETQYAISIKASYPGISYPVTVDMTPRRLQNFKLKPGQKISVSIGTETNSAVVDDKGLLTIQKIKIPSAESVRISLSSSQ